MTRLAAAGFETTTALGEFSGIYDVCTARPCGISSCDTPAGSRFSLLCLYIFIKFCAELCKSFGSDRCQSANTTNYEEER